MNKERYRHFRIIEDILRYFTNKNHPIKNSEILNYICELKELSDFERQELTPGGKKSKGSIRINENVNWAIKYLRDLGVLDKYKNKSGINMKSSSAEDCLSVIDDLRHTGNIKEPIFSRDFMIFYDKEYGEGNFIRTQPQYNLVKINTITERYQNLLNQKNTKSLKPDDYTTDLHLDDIPEK